MITCKGFKHGDAKILSVVVFLDIQKSFGNKIFPGHRFSILVFISSKINNNTQFECQVWGYTCRKRYKEQI